MNQHDLQKTIEEFCAKLNIDDDELADRFLVGVWIPEKFKEDYKQVQKSTKKKFSSLLRSLIVQAIEEVKRAG